ncbi:S8 family serine peptidase [Kamptonema formosum]|uniref:S8 family serine peptidase n=1 Tax=Kamptonema formosum TaxID=331992 RepID=UPI0003466B6F|nr:S8 family serine peptidase [Oscillatoria sp. PCC 10802]
MLDINTLFDESYYLAENPDVAGAVASGGFSSGLDHFTQFGQFEDRQPSVLFDPDFYTLYYPDVGEAVATGEITALEHFINFGQEENRDPFSEFYTDIYLEDSPDVAAAVQRDELTGIEHFVKFGQYENRDFGPGFDTGFYLAQNSDVAAAVSPGGLSAIKHYLEFGQFEGRAATPSQVPANLNEASDLGTLASRTVSGFVGDANFEDIYRFSISATSDFSLTLGGLSADADLSLIQDFNGNGEIDFDEYIDSSATGGNSDETLSRILQPGTYFVAVQQYAGDTNYTLSLSASPLANVPQDLAGQTPNAARDIGTLSATQTLTDFVGNADFDDLYRFSLNTVSSVSLSLNGLSADADLYLAEDLNNDGAIVDQIEILSRSIESGSAAEAINISTLNPGTYFIRVQQYQGDTNYSLSVSAAPAAGQTNTSTSQGNFNSNYGFGLVNAAAAVAGAIGETTPFADVPSPVVNNYGLDLINAPDVWARGYTGAGVTVAVLDTGIDLKHRDLQGRLWRNSDEVAGDGIDNDGNGFIDDVQGYDFADGDADPSNNDAEELHGTHVAGIIAAARNGTDGTDDLGNPFEVTGVAYNATIMPVRVLGDFRTVEEFDSAVAAGIRYAVNNGARVLQMSLGNSPGDPSLPQTAAALAEARQRGVVAAIAAGNEKGAGGNVPDDPAIRAAEDLAIAVGAVDRNRQLAYFSNSASSLLGIYDFVVAPGVDVRSATPNNSYASLDGTSMATPYVAGVIALMLQANPNLTPAQIENILSSTASPAGITV